MSLTINARSTLSSGRTVVGPQWTPANLFASSEQGVWFDPSDLSTMFQDSAGTLPVTGVEQSVGLILDKSKGLTLGSELFSGFNTLGLWADIGGGSWSITNAASQSDLQTVTLGVTGRTYLVSVTVVSVSGSVFVYPLNTSPAGPYTTPGTYTFRAQANSGGIANQLWIRATTGTSAVVSSISVRELPGNHAFQSSSTARPTLRARYNLLTQTEDFSQAVWAKSQATVTLAPDSNAPGVMYAINSANDSINSTNRYIGQTVVISTNTQYRTSFYAKAGTITAVRFRTLNDDANRIAQFALTGAGSVTSTVGGVVATITELSGGVYYCTATWTSGTDTSILCVYSSDVSTLGDGSILFYVSAPSFVPTNALPQNPYQRVTTATDYDSNPLKFPYYLDFDGGDALATASINFTATDKMTVVAGVRKNSDAGGGMLVELGPGGTDGSFYVTAPESGATYGVRTRGTTNAAGYNHATFAAPITNVIAFSLNNAGAGGTPATCVQSRFNGVENTTGATGATVAANYGTWPIYLGARAGTGTYFTGRIHQLIVRGATTDAANIRAAERFVSIKTGINF